MREASSGHGRSQGDLRPSNGEYLTTGLPHGPGPSTTLTHVLAWGGIIGPVLFVAAFSIAGALRPGYSPIHQAISALGTGADGWREDIPAIILGVMLLAFAASFALSLRAVMAKGSLVAGTILLTIFALVWITVGLFTAAPPTRAVHTTASVVGELAAIAALIVIGVGLRRSPTWRAWSLSSIIAGAVALVLVLLTFKTSQRSIPASERLGGLMERLLVIELLLWFVAFGWKLVRTGNRTAAGP